MSSTPTPTVTALLALTGHDSLDALCESVAQNPSPALRTIDLQLSRLLWDIESAERQMRDELAAITCEAGKTTAALDEGNDTRFPAQWVGVHANKVAKQHTRLRASIDMFQVLVHIRKTTVEAAA